MSATGQTNRKRTEFACTRCGYEVYADVSAAINLAVKHAEG